MSNISPGTVIVGIFAVLFGIVGAYAVRKALQQPPPVVSEAEPERLEAVPIASIDLEPGRPLTLGDIAILRLRPEQIKEQGFPPSYMRNTQQIMGRTLREPAVKGQPFLTTQFYPEGLGPSVADQLKPGFRAVTVPIVNANAVAGMAGPGTFVDVLFRTLEDSEESLPETTVTLLESVEVLALGNSTVPGTRLTSRSLQETTVTLAVSPQQAAALRVVAGRGELSLTVRNPNDLEYLAEPQPQTLESLLGIGERMPPVMTDVYRGTSKQTNQFELDQSPPPRITGRPVRRQAAQPQPGTLRSASTPMLPPRPEVNSEAPSADQADATPDSALENSPVSNTATAPTSTSAGGADGSTAGPTDSGANLSPTGRDAAAQNPAPPAVYRKPSASAPVPGTATSQVTPKAQVSPQVSKRPQALSVTVPSELASSPEASPSSSKTPAIKQTVLPPDTWNSARFAQGRFTTRVYAGQFTEDRVFENGKRVKVEPSQVMPEVNDEDTAVATAAAMGGLGKDGAR